MENQANTNTTNSNTEYTAYEPTPTPEYSPLQEPVKNRSYTNHKVDPNEANFILEEPTFERPNMLEMDAEEQENIASEPKSANPTYSQLDGKEKTMGAEMMADMTLDIYEKGCFYIGKIPEISEAKLDKLIGEGEIDADIRLQTEAGAVPIKEFALEYNDSIKEAFQVSEDFKEKVRPPLIRVFKKRGIGMTDEQLLAYYFVTDLGAKGAQAFMLKRTANNIIDSLRENTQARREQSQPRQQPRPPSTPNYEQAPPPPPPPPPPAQASQPAQEYSDDIIEIVEEKKVTTTRAKKASEPKTNLDEQVETFISEPEEKGSSVFSILHDQAGFGEDYVEVEGMPDFGNPDMLNELGKISKQSKEPKPPVRKGTGKGTGTRKRK